MLKMLFKPYYSIFEFVFIVYIMMLCFSYSFWFILLMPVGVLIQIHMTNKIIKQEIPEKENDQ